MPRSTSWRRLPAAAEAREAATDRVDAPTAIARILLGRSHLGPGVLLGLGVLCERVLASALFALGWGQAWQIPLPEVPSVAGGIDPGFFVTTGWRGALHGENQVIDRRSVRGGSKSLVMDSPV